MERFYRLYVQMREEGLELDDDWLDEFSSDLESESESESDSR